MIRDAFLVGGFVLMTYGLWARFGFDVACIITGAVLVTLAVFGAIQK